MVSRTSNLHCRPVYVSFSYSSGAFRLSTSLFPYQCTISQHRRHLAQPTLMTSGSVLINLSFPPGVFPAGGMRAPLLGGSTLSR